jgi:precorrin-6B methylase 2
MRPLRDLLVRALRAAVLRPERVWRIPLGVGRGLRFAGDASATLHLYAGTAEWELAPHIRRLARPGCQAFDIGSHNAYYSLVLARLTGRQVVAFDFADEAIQRIQRNLAHNPELAARVRICRSYVAFETNPQTGATTLDDLLTEHDLPEPDLIKIDVEGAEAWVLQGAGGLLRRRRPHLIIETHSAELERECAELLLALGYRPRVVTQRRRLREPRGTLANRWLVAEGAVLPRSRALADSTGT